MEVAKFQATRKATPTVTGQVDQDRAHLTRQDRRTTLSLALAHQEVAQEAAQEASLTVKVEVAQDQDRMNENRGRTKKRRNQEERADHGKRITATTALREKRLNCC